MSQYTNDTTVYILFREGGFLAITLLAEKNKTINFGFTSMDKAKQFLSANKETMIDALGGNDAIFYRCTLGEYFQNHKEPQPAEIAIDMDPKEFAKLSREIVADSSKHNVRATKIDKDNVEFLDIKVTPRDK